MGLEGKMWERQGFMLESTYFFAINFTINRNCSLHKGVSITELYRNVTFAQRSFPVKFIRRYADNNKSTKQPWNNYCECEEVWGRESFSWTKRLERSHSVYRFLGWKGKLDESGFPVKIGGLFGLVGFCINFSLWVIDSGDYPKRRLIRF